MNRFYYADERTPSGEAVMRDIDGDAAGRVYLKLAETPTQQPWLYTYVKDNNDYVDFGELDYLKTRDSDGANFLKGGRQ